jgi:hypothetical protein
MIRIIAYAALAMLPLLATGCQALHLEHSKKFPWVAKTELKESKFSKPARMVAIWTDAVYNQAGKPATRGFGGRLYFYNNQNQTVPVEGQLVVYAYDDSNEDKVREAPDKKFVFTPDQFTRHYSESDFGASYSVWIPWDTVGGMETPISLVPVFTSSTGDVVIGQQTMNVLPGRKTPVEQAQSFQSSPANLPQIGSVQQVTYQQPVAGQSDQVREASLATGQASRASGTFGSSGMRTVTIPVPPSMSQKIMQPPPELAESRSNYPPNYEDARYWPTRQPGEQFDARQFDSRQSSVPQSTGNSAAMAPGSTMAESTAMPTQMPPPTHFVRPRYRALREPVDRPTLSHDPWQPYQQEPQSGLPLTPQSGRPTYVPPGSYPVAVPSSR